MGKDDDDKNSVRVARIDGEMISGSFVFYPWERDKVASCIMGCDGRIRIPTGPSEWSEVGPGRHVRVNFDDGMNYLGVVAYQTACKDWHVFFEDGEEIDIKVCIAAPCLRSDAYVFSAIAITATSRAATE